MPKFRKKPVVIEAVRWDPFMSGNAYPEWVHPLFGKTSADDIDSGCLRIPTLEGEMLARPGDYIIQGVKGELYPCKPDIFEATYEPADDAANGN
jgi:hypothetical protein